MLKLFWIFIITIIDIDIDNIDIDMSCLSNERMTIQRDNTWTI